MSNLKEDGLQQQKITLGSTSVSNKQSSEAISTVEDAWISLVSVCLCHSFSVLDKKEWIIMWSSDVVVYPPQIQQASEFSVVVKTEYFG